MPHSPHTSNTQKPRNSSPPLLTTEDQVRHAFNQRALWEWKASDKACEACRALHGKRFTYLEIPLRPHPNCKCQAVPVEQNKIRITGWMSGFEGHAWEQFQAAQCIYIDFKNIGAHLTGVEVVFPNEMTPSPEEPQATGAIWPSQTKTLKFTQFGSYPVNWKLFMRIVGGDNTTIQYTITD